MVYATYYDLDLFSNFTYFLEDPVHGDQIEQQDHRYVLGGKASQTWFGDILGAPMENTVGLDVRNDDIHNGLFHTEDRIRIGTTTINSIAETSASPYFESRTKWTDWFRTVLGVRGDFCWFDVQNIVGGNSGNVQAALFSPKLSLIFGPWDKTEFYVNGGYGYHSNDARGVVSNVDPATALPRSKGAEAGVRTTILPGLQSSLSFWLLDLQSELVWDGDEGTNEPSGPTRRYGIEFANFYTPTDWLTIDADYAWSHARFTDDEPDGNYVPEALVAMLDGGVAVHDLDGPLSKFYGGLRLRYFGPRPLTQDGTIKSKSTTLLYADIGYAIDERWSIALDVFNLLDARASDIDYFYTSRLPGEPLEGVDDIQTHPAEPREFRVAVTARL
ncbi:MAG: TonB-dependent receptor [Rhizomicrobium sp.]